MGFVLYLFFTLLEGSLSSPSSRSRVLSFSSGRSAPTPRDDDDLWKSVRSLWPGRRPAASDHRESRLPTTLLKYRALLRRRTAVRQKSTTITRERTSSWFQNSFRSQSPRPDDLAVSVLHPSVNECEVHRLFSRARARSSLSALSLMGPKMITP